MGYTSEKNKNKNLNIVCWNCEHFQPSRDPTAILPHGPQPFGKKTGIEPEPTSYCNGECRKNPPFFHFEIISTNPPGYIDDCYGYFGFIPLGNLAWCSGFQRAIVPLPAPVVPEAMDCADYEIVNWFIPKTNDSVKTYRKVPPENSCWYCQHFQSQLDEYYCSGWCQKDPPVLFSSQTNLPENVLQYHFPYIKYSYYKWCSKWERSQLPVPAPPSQLGVPCAPQP
jgi:hypothetical protein